MSEKTMTMQLPKVPTSNLSSPAFDLAGLSIEAVLASAESTAVTAHNPGPYHKYDHLVVHGFTRQLTSDEVSKHPLITLLHDFKHLMLHGDRGGRVSRRHKRKRREPYENSYCRIGFVYLITQNAQTHDINIGFIIDTAFQPVWTEFDGSVRAAMAPEEVVETVDNFIESYLFEAQAMVAGEPFCEIAATTKIES